LRDLLEPTARSVGLISVDEGKGITEIAKPVGVVGAVTPSTNPAATPELMEQVDFLTVTGSASNVRAGQTSGTPNACVSAGNVVSIVDRTADNLMRVA
jgi:sulfoacetaldehyde dehydrogenase